MLGHDPQQRSRELRERMGIVLQSTGMYRHITVREAIAHWARFYPAPRDVDEVLELAGLEARRPTRTRGRSPAASCAASTSRSRSSATPS